MHSAAPCRLGRRLSPKAGAHSYGCRESEAETPCILSLLCFERTGPVQAAEWCREGLALFQVATGFHCAEIQLSQADGLADWWCVLTGPELGRVPLEEALALSDEPDALAAALPLSTHHFALVWRVWQNFLKARSQAPDAGIACPLADASCASPPPSSDSASLGVLGSSGPSRRSPSAWFFPRRAVPGCCCGPLVFGGMLWHLPARRLSPSDRVCRLPLPFGMFLQGLRAISRCSNLPCSVRAKI